MAKILQAVTQFGPKLILKTTAQLDKVSNWMAMRTGMNKSEVLMSLQELSDAILYFASEGTPVKLPGVGTFTPSIDRKGVLKINFRPDKALKAGINVPGAYTGEITNKRNVGLDDAGYKQLWDAAHPDDKLAL